MTQNQTQPNPNDILYEDDNVKITSQSIKVNKFYFPQTNNNEIKFKDINKLGLKQMDPMDQTLGVDSSFFDNFKSKVQSNQNMYIQIALQDQTVRLSFAPQQPNKVYKIIQQKWEDSKIQAQKQSTQQPLQQKNLYSNVQVSKESIEKAMKEIKKSQGQKPSKEDAQNEKKRNSPSPSRKLKQDEEGQNPKKKIKSDKDQINQQNFNPNVVS